MPATPAQRPDRVGKFLQRVAQRFQRVLHTGIVCSARSCKCRAAIATSIASAARGPYVPALGGRLQRREPTLDAGTLGDRVARQPDQRPRAQALAEELRGKLGQLVGLVDDECLRAGQDLAEAFLLEREVGQQADGG